MNRWLFREGTARRNGTNCSVVFDRVRCVGCDGRCGVAVGADELPLDVGLPNGTRVRVVVSAHDIARRALGVFGWPLGALATGAVVAEWFGASEGLIVAALLGTALAVVVVRAGSADRFARVSRNSAPDEAARVVLE